MQFEAFSHPKARDLSVQADDVILHIPGRVTALFDGATDSRGRQIDGIPFGRVAAIAAADATAALARHCADWPALRILSELSRAVAAAAPTAQGEGPASTTAMIAFETPDAIRLVGVGDTGHRLNGKSPVVHELAPDRATIPARVSLLNAIRTKTADAEASEDISRQYVGRGLDAAVADGLISEQVAGQIVEHAIRHAAIPGAEDEITFLLRNGLKRQFEFANNPAKRLRYGVLNGTEPDPRDVIDHFVDRADLTSLELFTDGYMVVPPTVGIDSWEKAHRHIETIDPYKIDQYPAVKGSNRRAFFDDRSIVILRY